LGDRIWSRVEQICINQSETQEHSAQVFLMKQIYLQCEMCFCYPGEGG